SAAAAPSPVMGNMPPNDAMPGGPMAPGFFQGPPGSQQSPHAQPPPHNPSNPMMGPHGQVRIKHFLSNTPLFPSFPDPHTPASFFPFATCTLSSSFSHP
ncbi:hypothetical protein XENOCAPTIV_012744, partial [Xenoophorus captivus]